MMGIGEHLLILLTALAEDGSPILSIQVIRLRNSGNHCSCICNFLFWTLHIHTYTNTYIIKNKSQNILKDGYHPVIAITEYRGS